MTQMITTDSVLPARRVGYWQAAVRATFGRGDGVSRAGPRFVGRMHSRVLGRLQCSLVDSVEQRVDRTPANIAADGADCFLLSLQREGRGCLTQLGRDAHLAPGDLVLYDTAVPYRLEPPEKMQHVVLKIPPTALRERMASAESQLASRLDGRRLEARLLAAMLSTLTTADEELPAVTGE